MTVTRIRTTSPNRATSPRKSKIVQLEKRICSCPCRRSFIAPIRGNRQFFERMCAYHFVKNEIRQGKLPPDYYAKCVVCGEWFPCWSFLARKSIPKKCSSPVCQKGELSITLKDSIPIGVISKYSYKKALILRATFCTYGPSGGQDQCAHYSKCLFAELRGEKIFYRFFETGGGCYEEIGANTLNDENWRRIGQLITKI